MAGGHGKPSTLFEIKRKFLFTPPCPPISMLSAARIAACEARRNIDAASFGSNIEIGGPGPPPHCWKKLAFDFEEGCSRFFPDSNAFR